ncbi:MAG: 50S ribosomal protein L21 [bacterium]|nr:50S ribosomal protein L21 [bacterium]
MFAVIELNGKQFLIKEGDKIKIQSPKVGEIKVLLLAEQRGLNADQRGKSQRESALSLQESAWDVKIGTPYLDGKKVETKILKQGRERKKIVFRYQSKTRRRKKAGHRQHYTDLEIVSIK